MPREAGLFDAANGSVLEGYLLMSQTSANIPPKWIDRSMLSRKNMHKQVAEVLKKGSPRDIIKLREWETRYKKECFYRGIRILFELDRNGRTKL